MKKVWLSLGVVAVLTAVGCGGSGASDPLGSTNGNQNGPTTTVGLPGAGFQGTAANGAINFPVLTAGVADSYNGITLVVDTVAGGVVSASGIAGDPTSLRLVSSSPTPWMDLTFCKYQVGFVCPPAKQLPVLRQLNASTLDFDLLIEAAPAEITSVVVYMGPDNNKFHYYIPGPFQNSNFIHYSIPGSSFAASTTNFTTTSTSDVFQIQINKNGSATNTTACFVVDNVAWHP